MTLVPLLAIVNPLAAGCSELLLLTLRWPVKQSSVLARSSTRRELRSSAALELVRDESLPLEPSCDRSVLLLPKISGNIPGPDMIALLGLPEEVGLPNAGS